MPEPDRATLARLNTDLDQSFGTCLPLDIERTLIQPWNMLFLSFLGFQLFTGLVLCNVEKIIFTAPAATTLPKDASIDNLLLTSLSKDHASVRTYLNASFPNDAQPKGTESWLLLEGITPGQRYEVRICWLATQPTSFWLYTHSVTDTFETPSLVSSLSSYSYLRHSSLTTNQISSLQARRPQTNVQPFETSMLFLQIYAAADYFSLNKTLMENVPPVLADIILDPYLLNIFPQSLVPTAVYILTISVGAWFVSGWIANQLRQLSITSPTPIEGSDISNYKKSQ